MCCLLLHTLDSNILIGRKFMSDCGYCLNANIGKIWVQSSVCCSYCNKIWE
ncbi:hypothetical protein RchiOBHm_Chr4g0416041 [Rosa chinensis]|uniref:Uncharacterized protein n=1 Tax=Rosa chinensis TaxID=74649 RepID=A0A2P6QWT7_ROSCH|nr:hypothetical protein RchiOBHm_Chr4g0416041 [Rosa chinensis]